MSSVLIDCESNIATIKKLERDLDTVMPFCCTVEGSKAVTSARRFCTLTCARSSLVSGVKVSVTSPEPLAEALVLM